MSEIPEIIWIEAYRLLPLIVNPEEYSLDYLEVSVKKLVDDDTPYILKSKYDSLLKEKEELENENHRLKYVKCESCNGTGNCGGIPNVGLACVPCKGKGYLPFE